MNIILAGMNVDIDSISDTLDKRTDITPETISAAYARISRDPRPVNELRLSARREVDKARKSNQNIVYDLGHSSIAEHAVFNIDLIGISRLAVEEIEKSRLASYTEKSQRYITLQGDYVTPLEIKDTPLEKQYHEVISIQNEAYKNLFERLKPYFKSKYPQYSSSPKDRTMLEGWAKEDARYVLSLSTQTQIGMTINARNLEKMITRLKAHHLTEIKEIGRRLYEITSGIAPSLVKYTEPTLYHINTRNNLLEHFQNNNLISHPVKKISIDKVFFSLPTAELISASKDIDKTIAAALIFSSSQNNYSLCKNTADRLNEKILKEIYLNSFKYMEAHDPLLREFENSELTYEIEMSASCFAQMKRHRMATIISQPYDPSLGYVIPDSIKSARLEKDFSSVLDTTQDYYKQILSSSPASAEYILPNSAKKRILLKINLRELHHISRLREDFHAQWEIQLISGQMTKLARQLAPLSLMLTCGKDKFLETKNKLSSKSK